ncbi:hypothetical protein [Oleiharenicola sp. Vm1]|uniref:hypothetical protein n=1 Tax=Oleiharenicola sp. Vm1 TaxID=3398393 RepID=UPI0039F47040
MRIECERALQRGLRAVDVAGQPRAPALVERRRPGREFGAGEVAAVHGDEGRAVPQVGDDGGDDDAGAAARRGVDDVAEVGGEVGVDRLEPWVVSGDAARGEGLHAFPRQVARGVLTEVSGGAEQELAEAELARADAGADEPARRHGGQVDRAGAVGADDLVVAEVDHHGVGREVRQLARDFQDDV